MEKLALFFFFSSFFYLFFIVTQATSTTNNNVCTSLTCDILTGPYQVRFPFQLKNRQPAAANCGYPGYDLFCNNNSQTILNLPSGEVVVKQIQYYAQTLLVDPQFCLPNKILNFSLIDTPYTNSYLRNYTFFNCSSQTGRPSYRGAELYCLSNGPNYTVSVLPTDLISDIPAPNCRIISNLSLPARWFGDADSITELQLQWFMPECRSCERDDGTCGTKPKHPHEIVCFGEYDTKPKGLSDRVKYGLVFGLGLPGMLLIIVLIWYSNERGRAQRLQQTPNISSIPLEPHPTGVMGLDRSAIESYPTRVLEALPNDNEGTCSICLSDYKPREEVRAIPDCTHYFHVECIDEWLNVNSTCPVCRN